MHAASRRQSDIKNSKNVLSVFGCCTLSGTKPKKCQRPQTQTLQKPKAWAVFARSVSSVGREDQNASVCSSTNTFLICAEASQKSAIPPLQNQCSCAYIRPVLKHNCEYFCLLLVATHEYQQRVLWIAPQQLHISQIVFSSADECRRHLPAAGIAELWRV